MVKRAAWLSITPEPERLLPRAVATLRHGYRAPDDRVAAERAEIERLLLHGSQRRWLAYLHGVVELIDRRAASGDPSVGDARELASAVIANHHNLLLGLPGRAAQMTASDRAHLASRPLVTHRTEDPV
jgi:hypothetical protein